MRLRLRLRLGLWWSTSSTAAAAAAGGGGGGGGGSIILVVGNGKSWIRSEGTSGRGYGSRRSGKFFQMRRG